MFSFLNKSLVCFVLCCGFILIVCTVGKILSPPSGFIPISGDVTVTIWAAFLRNAKPQDLLSFLERNDGVSNLEHFAVKVALEASGLEYLKQVYVSRCVCVLLHIYLSLIFTWTLCDLQPDSFSQFLCKSYAFSDLSLPNPDPNHGWSSESASSCALITTTGHLALFTRLCCLSAPAHLTDWTQSSRRQRSDSSVSENFRCFVTWGRF